MEDRAGCTPACESRMLDAGALIRCRLGSLWVTHECRDAARLASPDIVLRAGEHHLVTMRGRYFLTALGGPPVRYDVEPPAARRAPPWRFWPLNRTPAATGR